MAKDLFSNQAELYAKYRPSYPKELIEYIVSFVNKKEMALDCATGNGQAAVLLAPFFQKVFAIDTSLKQISQAVNFKGITYLRGEAEKTSFDDNSFDLITVAQAYHWFEFDAFSAEATRIAKPGAIIAVWGYGLVRSTDRALENAISNFYTRVVGKYWDSERRYIDQGYTTIPLPSLNLGKYSLLSNTLVNCGIVKLFFFRLLLNRGNLELPRKKFTNAVSKFFKEV